MTLQEKMKALRPLVVMAILFLLVWVVAMAAVGLTLNGLLHLNLDKRTLNAIGWALLWATGAAYWWAAWNMPISRKRREQARRTAADEFLSGSATREDERR